MADSPAPLSADGLEVGWSTWDGQPNEALTLVWDNEAWTATGKVSRERIECVLRLAPTWHVRQFLLFRDLDEPDLWLSIDASHRWGEINGSYRSEFNGCEDIELSCTPFTATIPIRRLRLDVGASAEFDVISVDVESLAAFRLPVRYERVAERAFRRTALLGRDVREFEVDQFGLPVDEVGRFRRDVSGAG